MTCLKNIGPTFFISRKIFKMSKVGGAVLPLAVHVNIIRRKIAKCSKYFQNDAIQNPREKSEVLRQRVGKMVPIVRIG